MKNTTPNASRINTNAVESTPERRREFQRVDRPARVTESQTRVTVENRTRIVTGENDQDRDGRRDSRRDDNGRSRDERKHEQR